MAAAAQQQRQQQQRRAGADPAPLRRDDMVPWSTVEEALAMARVALDAKQRVAEMLRAEAQRLRDQSILSGSGDEWSRRAQRAEADSGSLLEQLESLIQAKRSLAAERAELERSAAMLRAERELLCHQLQAPPESGSLCRAVEAALAEARRAGVLEAQLRVVMRQRRALRMELDAARGAHAKQRAAWETREAAYRAALEEAGAPLPALSPMSRAHSEPGTAGAVHAPASPTAAVAAAGSSAGGSSVAADAPLGDAGGDSAALRLAGSPPPKPRVSSGRASNGSTASSGSGGDVQEPGAAPISSSYASSGLAAPVGAAAAADGAQRLLFADPLSAVLDPAMQAWHPLAAAGQLSSGDGELSGKGAAAAPAGRAAAGGTPQPPLRRALSLESGLDVAAKQEALEAVLERISLSPEAPEGSDEPRADSPGGALLGEVLPPVLQAA